MYRYSSTLYSYKTLRVRIKSTYKSYCKMNENWNVIFVVRILYVFFPLSKTIRVDSTLWNNQPKKCAKITETRLTVWCIGLFFGEKNQVQANHKPTNTCARTYRFGGLRSHIQLICRSVRQSTPPFLSWNFISLAFAWEHSTCTYVSCAVFVYWCVFVFVFVIYDAVTGKATATVCRQ